MWTLSPKRYLIVTLTFISTCICNVERVGFSNAYTAAADAAGVSQSSKGTIMAMPVHKSLEAGQLRE
ncbi:hypothetical protein CerSpe_287570 [Prunus speciosa]